MITDNIKRIESAFSRLTEGLLSAVSLCPEKYNIREMRFRSGRPAVIITDKGTFFISPCGRLTTILSSAVIKTDKEEIKELFIRICGYSVHSFTESVNRGYITISGGHRIGVAGTAVTENGRIIAVRDIECINFRIAREIKGAANGVFNECFSDGLRSVIIAGPPAGGKTTVLRDLARQLSGDERGLMKKVFVCDERGEIAASFCSESQNDIGINCDVVTSYPKGEGIMTGLRAFSPDVIICDEVSTDEEASAIECGVNSGVEFILSIHARSEKELKSKPILKRLLKTGAFDRIILLSSVNLCSVEKIIKAGDIPD